MRSNQRRDEKEKISGTKIDLGGTLIGIFVGRDFAIVHGY